MRGNLRRESSDYPDYLARHYWWAYLWPPATKFFDRQVVVNSILFGQYPTLLESAVSTCSTSRARGRVLQLTCAYGNLTPRLLDARDDSVFLVDVVAGQLELARSKVGPADRSRLLLARMNAERLAFRDAAFGTVVIFFLLHELPPAARARVVQEAARVLRPGGRLLINEYAPLPTAHWVYRFAPMRSLLTRAEPFLQSFWATDLEALVHDGSSALGRSIRKVADRRFFGNFYRYTEFEVGPFEADAGADADAGDGPRSDDHAASP